MKLHSRPGSYNVRLDASFPSSQFQGFPGSHKFQKLPPLVSVSPKRPSKLLRKVFIESYKPSSTLYQKLNVKIHINQLEFLKDFRSLAETGGSDPVVDRSCEEKNEKKQGLGKFKGSKKDLKPLQSKDIV
jgi:hypothetical protein